MPSGLPNLSNLITRSLATPQTLLAQHTTPRTARLLIIRTSNILNPNLRLRKGIHHTPIRRHEIHTNCIRKRRNKEQQRHQHTKLRAIPRIRRSTKNRRYDGATAHCADDPPRAALGVLAQAAHAQRDDGREDDGLEEQRDEQQGDAGVAAVSDRGRDEDDAAGEVEDEDPAGTHVAHQESTDEAAEGETALGSCEELGGGGVGVLVVGVGDVVDELNGVC